jgi:5-hydroxyisourate hydrolase-like protein (transthyretin family)
LTLVVASLLLPAAASAASSSAIKGTVTAPVSVSEVEVCLVEPLPSEACVFPEAGGTYTLPVPAAGVYQVEFLPSYRSHLVRQYYNHKAKLSEANKIVVPAAANVTGIDAALELGGQIMGQVTDTTGARKLGSVEVCAQDASTRAALSCTHTDAEGNYALPTLPTGSYRVGFWGERESSAYAPQYYEDKPGFLEATVLHVNVGETVNGIDAKLDPGAQLSGVVTDSATGTPLAAIAVCVLKSTAAGPERCTYTGTNGEYTLPGVTSGTYQVAFSPEFNEFAKEEFVLPEEDGWHTQYYAGSASREGSTTLTLSAPEQRGGVDAALLTTYVPPPAPPPAVTPSTSIPVPRVIALPPEKKKPKKCRKDYRKVKVGGAARCVKVRKHRSKHKRA